MKLNEESAINCLTRNGQKIEGKKIKIAQKTGLKQLTALDCLQHYYGYNVVR